MLFKFLSWPSQCTICHAWPSQFICPQCRDRFGAPHRRCTGCALNTTLAPSQSRCGACILSPPPWKSCHAAVDYAYPWAHCITQFKFHHQPGWAQPLAQIIQDTPWWPQLLQEADCLIPMPLSHARLRERGYNQALELAKHLSPAHTLAHTLMRLRDTPAQSGLKREQRMDNLKNSFMVDPAHAHHVRARHVVLVDDVMTTGASLLTATHALLQAGAAHVSTVVFARTPAPHE